MLHTFVRDGGRFEIEVLQVLQAFEAGEPLVGYARRPQVEPFQACQPGQVLQALRR